MGHDVGGVGPSVRYLLDPSYARHARVVIAGSPLRLFRLGSSGVSVAERLEAGDHVEASRLTDRLLDAGAIHPVAAAAHDGGGDADVISDRVTIVVPTLDDEPRQLTGRSRVIVVDDGSQPPITGASLRFDANRGPGAARNAGLALVDTDLVAFVDADVELPEDWLDRLVGHFDDPHVGLVAPRIRSTPGPSRLAAYERGNSPLDLGDQPARIRAGTRVSYVPAAAIVCRTEVIRALGGFDEALRFGEDVDLVWRLDQAGWRCRYEPDVEVVHRPRATWRAWARQRIGYGSSAAALAVRHPDGLAPVSTSGWSAAAWALGAIGHPVAGVAVGLGSAAALVDVLDDVPSAVAFRLAATGNAHAGRTFATAVRRVWLPIVGVAALRSRTARRILVASLLAAGHPVRVLDDVAYGVGVWRGMIRDRNVTPLVPRFTSWPGRRSGR